MLTYVIMMISDENRSDSLLSLMRFPESPLREILFLSFVFHNNTRKAGMFMICYDSKSAGMFMICYDSKSGSFPISRKDCELLASACEEQVIEMEKDLEAYGAEKYLRYKELQQRFLGIIKLMDARKIKEDERKKAEVELRENLRSKIQCCNSIQDNNLTHAGENDD